MFKFSTKSKTELSTCHEDLQRLFDKVIEGYDCSILQGYRSNEEQNKLFDEGKTKLRGGEGKHNQAPSLAIDVVPYPIDWNDKARFYHFIGYVKGVAKGLNIKIRCGADWDNDNSFKDQSFHDLPHFELIK